MPQVIYSPLAENDLCEIVTFIAQDKPLAARRWLQQIRDKCDLLAANPQIGQRRDEVGIEDCRSFSTGNYVILFRAVNDTVEISRIVRGERDIRKL